MAAAGVVLVMSSFDLDSLEVKGPVRGRKPLHRTRTLDGSYPGSSFGRLDKDSSQNDVNNNGLINGTQQPHKKKEKKNVRFVDESDWECHVFEPVGFNDLEQMKEFWVLPEELKEIKKQGFLACREAIRSGLAGLLTEIYGTGGHHDREVQDRLNYWCRMASSCRGLERFANEELSKRRTIFRKRAIVSVLEAQQQLKNEKGIDTANVLRRLSEAYTEQARAYAVKCGIADYHAIQTVKAPPPPPPPTSPKQERPTAAAAGKSEGGDQQQNGKRTGRKSRTERMKERAAATEQKNQQQQQQQQNGENGVFRRNNTTMTAVVSLKQ